MASNDAFFQFPLCLLALSESDPWETRLSTIIGYSIIDFGITNDIVPTCAGRPSAKAANKPKILKKLQDRLKFTGGEFDSLVANWRQADSVVEAYRKRFPASVGLVRIRADICFQSANGRGLNEREFRVLAAIYSAIGNHAVRQVTREQIIHRATGCVSRAVFNNWEAKVTAYSEKEVRSTVDALEMQNWFRCTVFNRRQKFYTHSLNDAELRARVIDMKTRRGDPARTQRKQMDEDMTRAILAARQGRTTAEAGPNEGQPAGRLDR